MVRQLSKVGGAFGAPMGRQGNPQIDPDASTKFSLQRVNLNHQGYDSGGAYWGTGLPLYWAMEENPVEGKPTELFFRAKDREAAKEHIRKLNPNAKFFR
jgi:hypothetical protein